MERNQGINLFHEHSLDNFRKRPALIFKPAFGNLDNLPAAAIDGEAMLVDDIVIFH